MIQNFFSENWEQATEKFYKSATNSGELLWCTDNQHKFDIPYAIIGNGPNVVLMLSGINGIQGYYGSAAQNLFLDAYGPKFRAEMKQKFTFVLIHAVNGWGMQYKMPGRWDKKSGAMIDINRNIGTDFANRKKLPKNPGYNRMHNLLLTPPQPKKKIAQIKKAYQKMPGGRREKLFRGQYEHKNGLFFGGTQPVRESLMINHILERVMPGAKSLTAINFTTGPVYFTPRDGMGLMCQVYSFGDLNKINYFSNVMGGFSVSGVDDMVRYDGLPAVLEQKYADKMPVYSANWCVGTYKSRLLYPEYMMLHLGNAYWEYENRGMVSPSVHKNMIGLWCGDRQWQNCAMVCTDGMFFAFVHRLNNAYGNSR